MKKLFVAAMVFAVAVMATGCIQGTVKKVGIRYSYADYNGGKKIICKGVTHYAACGEKGNLLLRVVPDMNGYPIITGGGIATLGISAINSDSAGIWINFMAGTLVDPNTSCGAFKANTYCEGVVRVCGTGTYSKNHDAQDDQVAQDVIDGGGVFTGSGKFIVMHSGATEMCGTGKLDGVVDTLNGNFDGSKCSYKGIMNILITPGFAYLVEVEDGVIQSQIPVQASISLPCIPIWNTPDIIPEAPVTAG